MQHHAEYGHFCWIHQKQRIDDWRTECEMATKVPALSSHSPASPQGCGTRVTKEGTVTGTTESVTCPPAQSFQILCHSSPVFFKKPFLFYK